MTRGTGFLITDDLILYTDEFNGDMYPEGYGEDFLLTLNEATEKTFGQIMQDWNEANHNYDNFEIHSNSHEQFKPINKNKLKDIIVIDFKKDYFEWFFSDWTFFKNVSNLEVKFLTRDFGELSLYPGESIAIEFGYLKEFYTPESIEIKGLI